MKEIESKSKKILKIMVPVILLMIVIGVSYAYWRLTNTQSDTNVVNSLKCLNTTLTEENSGISMDEAYPISNIEGMSLTPHTFTITNICTESYVSIAIMLEVLNSTTIGHEYTRASLNMSGSTKDNSNLLTNYEVNEATIAGATSYALEQNITLAPNDSATYDLRLWMDEATTFEEAGNKSFQAKIVIAASAPRLRLAQRIFEQGGGVATIEAKADPNFSAISNSSDTGIYAMPDDYGMSYYYRGDKVGLKNNLVFAGFQWKIVRINGDGSIRIIYNGTCPNNAIPCNGNGMNDTHANTVIGSTSILNTGTNYTHVWNSVANDNKYVGYMYGGANGVASTQKNGLTSVAATYNETSSNAKIKLESWYENNLANKGSIITSKIADSLFCNDRQLASGGYGSIGFGNTGWTYYVARDRLHNNKVPTLMCIDQNDRFTEKDALLGNAALTYPVGLITADEIALAGGIYNVNNTSYYLYVNQTFWTFNPISFYDGYAYVWHVTANGGIGTYSMVTSSTGSSRVTQTYGLRPVINLKSDVVFIGDGSLNNPFVIK